MAIFCLFFCFYETQAEAKKLEDSSLYLNLPATKVELEEKGYSATGKSTQSLGNCTISKDFFQISTLVCSTKLTQNGKSEPGEVVAASFVGLIVPVTLPQLCSTSMWAKKVVTRTPCDVTRWGVLVQLRQSLLHIQPNSG